MTSMCNLAPCRISPDDTPRPIPAPPCVVVLSEFPLCWYDYQSVQRTGSRCQEVGIIAGQCSAALVVHYGFNTSPHAVGVLKMALYMLLLSVLGFLVCPCFRCTCSGKSACISKIITGQYSHTMRLGHLTSLLHILFETHGIV